MTVTSFSHCGYIEFTFQHMKEIFWQRVSVLLYQNSVKSVTSTLLLSLKNELFQFELQFNLTKSNSTATLLLWAFCTVLPFNIWDKNQLMSLFQFYLYIAGSLHVSGPQAHPQESFTQLFTQPLVPSDTINKSNHVIQHRSILL